MLSITIYIKHSTATAVEFWILLSITIYIWYQSLKFEIRPLSRSNFGFWFLLTTICYLIPKLEIRFRNLNFAKYQYLFDTNNSKFEVWILNLAKYHYVYIYVLTRHYKFYFLLYYIFLHIVYIYHILYYISYIKLATIYVYLHFII